MIAEPACWTRNCKHFGGVKRRDPKEEATEFVWCKAFPDGIPYEIAYGDNKHVKPFKGDNDIQFEKGGERE